MLDIGIIGGLPSGNGSPTQVRYAPAGDCTGRRSGGRPDPAGPSRVSPKAAQFPRSTPGRARPVLISAPGFACTPAGATAPAQTSASPAGGGSRTGTVTNPPPNTLAIAWVASSTTVLLAAGSAARAR